MAYQKYAGNNFAQGLILGGLSSDGVVLTLKSGQGGLFPSVFPFLLVIEKYNTSGIVTRREIVKCTNRSGDNFTIVRAFESCPSDYQATTQTQTPFSFDDGDQVSLCFTSSDHKDIQDEVSRLETDKLNKSTYYAEQEVFSASVTGNDAYKITSSTVTAYNNGQTFKVQADVGNDGACTLELNSLGAKFIKKYVSGALANLETGDIVASQIFWVTYNFLADCFQFSVDPATATIPIIEATKSQFIAGENLNKGDAVCQIQENSSNFTTAVPLGRNTNEKRISIKMFGGGVLGNTIDVVLSKAGTPTQNLNFRIETDNNGNPSGTVVTNGTGSIAQGSITTGLIKYTVTLAGNVTLTKGIPYHLVVFAGTYGTETIDNINYYNLGAKTTELNTAFFYKIFDSNNNWLPFANGVDLAQSIGDSGSIGSTSGFQGIKFSVTAPKGIFIKGARRMTGFTGTTIQLHSGTLGNIVGSGTISGEYAYFSTPVYLPLGTEYWIGGTSGASYSYAYISGGYPRSLSGITLTSGTSLNTSFAFNIREIISQEALDNTNGYADKNIFNFSNLYGNDFVYKADASNSTRLNVIGFNNDVITVLNNTKIDTAGVSSTLTGLTIGSDYYLSNTPGLISSTPGTNIISVGKSIGSTLLQLQFNRIKQGTVITPTVGASPFTYQNTTGRPIILSITGGTVSVVAFSRDNTNFFQTASTTNTILTLGVNDYCRVTYTVTPVLKVFTL